MAAPSAADLAAGVPPTADIVQRVPSGGGELLLDANGGVYAIGGARFADTSGGSYFGYLATTGRLNTETRRRFGAGGLTLDEGGYTLRATSGEQYRFNYNQPPGRRRWRNDAGDPG